MIDATADAIVPQHAVLVLPSDGTFDSRAYRIARTLVERGHRVTILARQTRGSLASEVHPLGYPILRVPASSADGLPLKPVWRLGGKVLRRLRGRPIQAATDLPGSDEGAEVDAVPDGPAAPAARPARRASLPRRVMSGLIHRFRIPLTLRSHIHNARAIAPAADLYHGMAYLGIPIALDLAKRHRAAAVYDARDIYMDARNLAKMRGPARWLIARAERGWARRSGRVVTVNQAYADVMAGRWGVQPLVVMNCSYRFEPPDPPERRFHDALDLPADRRVVLYHGGLFPERGIEELLAAIPSVPNATLVLMGYGVLEPQFRARAAEPDLVDRVRLLPPVPPAELLSWVASADVVAMPIQPSTLNHRLTTPNKLFEAMAAGVPVVASDLPGMATIVRETGCGRLVDPADPVAIASAINAILDAPADERAALRRACLEAAHATYTWESQVTGLLDEYSRLTGRRW